MGLGRKDENRSVMSSPGGTVTGTTNQHADVLPLLLIIHANNLYKPPPPSISFKTHPPSPNLSSRNSPRINLQLAMPHHLLDLAFLLQILQRLSRK